MLFMSEYAASVHAYAAQPPAHVQQDHGLGYLIDRQYMSSLHAKGEPVDIHYRYSSAPVPTGIADYGEEETRARKLLETGFEYVCSHNDEMLFRKRIDYCVPLWNTF